MQKGKSNLKVVAKAIREFFSKKLLSQKCDPNPNKYSTGITELYMDETGEVKSKIA